MDILFEKLNMYFQYPFVRYAMIVGILIALCSSLLGVTLVLKRFSFIGDGLANVAFGAVAISMVLNFSSSILIVAPITVLSAILLLRTSQHSKIKGDAAVALVSVSSLAIGYLLINLFPTSSNLSADVCATLFGSTSILTLRKMDVLLCIGISILVLGIFIFFYNKIFAVTFDEDFSVATGIKAGQYNMLIAIITALVIVLAMNLVGSLLTTALIIFPALSAMRVFKSFKAVVICSVIFSVFCTAIGILVSILAGTPVGSTIVAIDILGFLIFSILGLIMRRF